MGRELLDKQDLDKVAMVLGMGMEKEVMVGKEVDNDAVEVLAALELVEAGAMDDGPRSLEQQHEVLENLFY